MADRWGIAFVRAGNFALVVDGVRHQLAAGAVLITRPGLAFRCAHGVECPDDVCVSVNFSPDAVTHAEHAWERAGWWAKSAATPRLGYVQRRMAMAIEHEDHFSIERWALGALTALEYDSRDLGARGHYSVRSRDIERIVASSQAIEANPTARESIASRASAVGLTSTRLTHGFRRYLGVSPHQYVIRHRLAAAAELLSDGVGVSESCYRAGFENLSHFCRSFQRALGVRPSAWRTLTLPESRQRVQDLLRWNR